MIKQFKKSLVLFLLIGSHQLIYSQDIPNTGVSLNSSTLQGRCAPIDISVSVTWPEDNNSTTEYIFILHDEGDSNPLSSSIYQTHSFFHSDSLPESILFSFNSSSCNANNSSYVVDYFIKDSTSLGDFASVSGEYVGNTGGFSVYGELQAGFSSQSDVNSCGVYTFVNESFIGESIGENNTCSDAPVTTIEWFIDTDTSNYSIIDGSLGDGPSPATDSLTIQFDPGFYDIIIFTNNFECFDSETLNICVEEYDFDLNELNIEIPDTVCVNAPIIIENDIDEIDYSCISTIDDWFEWNISQVELTCTYDDQAFLPNLEGNNPSFSIQNPGSYEIRFISTHPCIDPPIEFIDTIIVQGHPIIVDSTFIITQNCDLSADISVGFDTCSSVSPFVFEWVPQEFVTYEDESIDSTSIIFQNSGSYTIEYIISSEDNICGADTAFFEVLISDTLNLSLGDDISICENDDITISPTIFAGVGELDYLWQYGGDSLTDPILELFNLDSVTEIVLEVTDDSICSVRDTMQILIESAPFYSLDPLFTKCEGVDFEIFFNDTIEDGHTVFWDFNNITNDTLDFNIDDDTLINVSVTSSIGCIFYDSTLVQISSINEDFINFPDSIVFCSLDEDFLIDSINHPSILTEGFWSGDNIGFPGNQGDNTFFTDSYGSFMVYYTKENQFGCQITDSAIVEVSSFPASEFVTDNDQFACVPSESFVVFSDQTLANPINTSYTFEVFAGEDQIDTTISFDQSSITDSLFFNLQFQSCGFSYEDSVYSDAYFLKLEADNVCKTNDIYNSRPLYTAINPIADFTYTQPNACHIEIEYDFINTTPESFNAETRFCSSPDIQWQISGNENIDWLIDSLSIQSDTFEVTFLNIGSYDVTLITTNSCSTDSITKTVVIEESPLANVEIEVLNNNLCSSDNAIIYLSEQTYLNPDTTSYILSIYGGQDNLIDTLKFTQSTLPEQDQGILLDSINSSSCAFSYDNPLFNGGYKVKIEAFNICNIPTIDSSMIYYAESAILNFSIDSSEKCTNQWYEFSDSTDLSQNNFNSCSDSSFTYWEISGSEGLDWLLDPSFELGDSLNAGSSFLAVQFLKSDVYSVSLISNSCLNDTLTKSICVETNLSFIEQEGLILFDEIVCLNDTLDIVNDISNTQSCGMEFLWSITPTDIACNPNQSLDFELTSETNPVPEIIFFNPGIYQLSCRILNSCEDTLFISKALTVLKSPELSSFEVNYESQCDSNHISIDLAIDSCLESFNNPIWGFDNSDSLISYNDNFIELVFSDYDNNEIQYTVSNICFTYDTVYIHNYTPFIDSFGPDIDLCLNPEYNLELDNDSLNGYWSLNDELLPTDSLGIYLFIPDEIGLTTLIYSYTNSDSCEISKSLNINVQESPQFVSDVSDQECLGVEVPFEISLSSSLYSLVSDVNFFWIDTLTEATILPLPTDNPTSGVISSNTIGEYTSYFYFEYESCYSFDSMTFIPNGADFSIVTDSNPLCDGDTASLGLQIESVSDPYTILWEPSAQTFEPIEVYPNITTTYIASITDANSCVSTDTLVLDVLCSNQTLVDFEPFIVENETQALFPNISSFDTVLYEGCTGANFTFFRPECIDIDQEILIRYKLAKNSSNINLAQVEADTDFYLETTSDIFALIIPSDSTSATLGVNTYDDSITEIPDTLVITINGIEYTDCFKLEDYEIEFVIKDKPDFELNITDPFTTYCPGDDAFIEVTPNGGVGSVMIDQGSTSDIAPYIYEWAHIGSSASQIMNPTDTTTYSVIVTDVCGQKEEASVEVSVIQYDPLLVDADRTYVCEDTLAQICVYAEGGESNYTYSWSNGFITDCIEVLHQSDPYTVTVTDGCDNQVSADAYVFDGEPENPYFEYLPTPHTEFGIEFYNYTPSIFDHTYLWSFDDTFGSNHYHPIHVFNGEGLYNVTLTVSDSLFQDCKKEFSSNVNVESFFKLWVPNSFTPNNDGINDFFKPVVIGFDFYELKISNRWGDIVFNSSDVNEYWDGLVDGNFAPNGIYKCEVVYSKPNDILKLSHYVNIHLIR